MSNWKKRPARTPRRAAGIRAQEVHSGSKAWWAARWIRALEELRIGPRLGRGRCYAESGQVTELLIDGTHVEATVVGSRPEPYRATLDFTAPRGEAREAIIADLLENPVISARLLAGEMPAETEMLFARRSAALFPEGGFRLSADGRKIYDVVTGCSCPDYANPCKHAAAALWLLGGEIARRPAALLALRGIDLREMLGEEADGPAAEPAAPDAEEPLSAPDFPAAPDCGGRSPMPLLKRLGPIPFWRGTSKCADELARIYAKVRPAAIAAASGESVDLRLETEKTVVKGAGLTLKIPL